MTPRHPRARLSPPRSASTCPMQRGRADSGDLEVDLTELLAEAASVAGDLGVGIALFVDEMQDIPTADVSALCAACHELSQTGRPADRGRRGPAAPASRALGEQELLRAAVQVRQDRPPRPRGRRPGADRPGPAGGRDLHRRSARRAVRRRGRLSLLRPGLRQGDLGRGRGEPGDGRRRAHGRPRSRGRAGRRVLRQPVRAGHAVRAAVHAGDGRDRGRPGADVGGGRRARAQAVQPVAGPGRADQEGTDLQLRARPDRVHRPALRQVPALPARLWAASPRSTRLSLSSRITESSR